MSTVDTRPQTPPATYDSVAKTFHWLTALLILTAIPLGLIANDWPYDSSAALQTKYTLFSLHKTVGVSVFFVALARILWALTHERPPLLHPERRIESWAAETVHWVLYGSLVLVPLSGWLDHSATEGFAPILWPFGQALPFVPTSEAVAQFFAAVHKAFVYLLFGALGLHVAGALKHHLIDGDATLRRMLPGRTVPVPPAQGHSRAPFWSALAIWLVAIGFGTVEGLSHAPQDTATQSELAAAPSQWSVEEGTLGITVNQGNGLTRGNFAEWAAEIDFDPEAEGETKGRVAVEIAISSLTLGSVTSQAMGSDFFDAEDHPTARFTAEIVETPDGPTGYAAAGTLTLKGMETPVTLPFDLTLEGETATISGRTELDRRQYGIGLPTYPDNDMIGFGVDVTVDLTATRRE